MKINRRLALILFFVIAVFGLNLSPIQAQPVDTPNAYDVVAAVNAARPVAAQAAATAVAMDRISSANVAENGQAKQPANAAPATHKRNVDAVLE